MSRDAPFGFGRVIFLSRVLGPGTPVFPGDPKVKISPVATIERDGYYLRRISFGEQSGTHWAAPVHFAPGGSSADQLDPADFFFPAAVIDFRYSGPGRVVTVADLTAWESGHGRIAEHACVLLDTGWDERRGGPRRGYPGFSGAAAAWLVAERGIAALGTDTMGIDPSADATYAANRALLGGHRIHLENLCHLRELPPTGAWIIVGGVRIAGGSGSPATVFALIPLATLSGIP